MSEKITRGSGNLFEDLGFDHPEEYQVYKSRLHLTDSESSPGLRR